MRKRPLGSKPVSHIQNGDVQLGREDAAVQVATVQVSKQESTGVEIDQERAPTGVWPVRSGDVAPHRNLIAIPGRDCEVGDLD